MTPDQERAVRALQRVLTPAHTALCLAELERVPSDDPELADRIRRLRRNDLTAVLALDPDDGRDERSFSLHRLGGTAPHCRALATTLEARWCLEELLAQLPAYTRGVEPTGLGPGRQSVATGDAVPRTGLWLAQDGCPNLLLAGSTAPEGIWATETIHWPDGAVGYETAERPTVWTLLE